jgi:hypothetical protein
VIGNFILFSPDSLVYEIVKTGVVTHVNANETVCASGAVPPADGRIGCTSKANDAPVSATNTTPKPVCGALVAAVHNASQSDDPAPQSANNSTARLPWVSVV